MIRTVLFDMGGTLEDIWYDETTADAACARLQNMLEGCGLKTEMPLPEFRMVIEENIAAYKAWSEEKELEKKPEEIWTEFYLKGFGFDPAVIAAAAEDFAGMWEVTYYHRELRPDVKETLEILKQEGYRLGVISNTASLYSVFDVLEGYQIRDYFLDVTLSSVTGYRKPHPEIFKISLRQMQADPKECCYVGDTVSRDIIGSKRLGFGAAVQIYSFLSAKKDINLSESDKPDHIIRAIGELPAYLRQKNAESIIP